MAPLSRSVARAASAAWGALAAVTLALPATAQPLDELPDFLAPDLPPGVELCGGAIVPEIPYHTAAAASTVPAELRPADPNVTHVIDIAFIYSPELHNSWEGLNGETVSYNIGQLRKDIAAAIQIANIAFARSNVNAALRFVGMEERDALRDQASLVEAVGVARDDLPLFRETYGADLVYAVTASTSGPCGRADLLMPYHRKSVIFPPRNVAAGGIWAPCLASPTLVHEVGHNLGLVHDIDDPYTPFVETGRGYVRGNAAGKAVAGTIMATRGWSETGSRIGEFSSADRKWLTTIPIGDATTDASRALLYAIEDASNYAPTKVRDPAPVTDCAESDTAACLDRGRFEVKATYSTNGGDGQAKERAAMLGGTGAMFYFFDPGNPELLVKVVNGCWLNDHYWVFGSAATDLPYTIRIADLTASGEDPGRWSTYHVQGGVIERRRADGESRILAGTVIADTYAFACASDAAAVEPGGGSGSGSDGAAGRLAAAGSAVAVTPAGATGGAATDYGCLGGRWSACLDTAARFRVSTSYRTLDDPDVKFARIRDAVLGDNASLFYFFEFDNPELLIKVLNGCVINDHYWVFGSAATDLDYSVYVEDFASGLRPDGLDPNRINTYEVQGNVVRRNGSRLGGTGVIADTFAFPCAP